MEAPMAEDEIKRQVGSIVSRAKEALSEVREAVVRTSQIGKLKIDVALLRREQEKAFARLGAKVFEMVEDGELSLPEPLDPLVQAVRHLARQIAEEEAELAEVEGA
nr:MAG: hypothetical protein DIU72_12155 [Pseudomonadota bacterium]